MNNPGVKEEIWRALNRKWDGLVSEGHSVNVEFKLIRNPQDPSKILAIDVAQNIDGEWHTQTVQKQVREAYPAVGIEGLTLDQLIDVAQDIVKSVTEPITGKRAYDEELHLFMKRISPETSEIHGHIISDTGERIGVRANYQHYYVINAILEQIADIMREEFAEIQLHRDKDDLGRIYYRFIHA
jgi:hypothetical protein